jgi:hypothetical protein
MNKICVRCGMEYPNHKMSCKIPVEEWRLPTAEEFLKLKDYNISDDGDLYDGLLTNNIIKDMVEFAKLHCEAQLKAILENVRCDVIQNVGFVDKDSILNAYSLDKII